MSWSSSSLLALFGGYNQVRNFRFLVLFLFGLVCACKFITDISQLVHLTMVNIDMLCPGYWEPQTFKCLNAIDVRTLKIWTDKIAEAKTTDEINGRPLFNLQIGNTESVPALASLLYRIKKICTNISNSNSNLTHIFCVASSSIDPSDVSDERMAVFRHNWWHRKAPTP